MHVEVYAGYVCVCRMRDNTHRAASKRVKVVFVMCILGAAAQAFEWRRSHSV